MCVRDCPGITWFAFKVKCDPPAMAFGYMAKDASSTADIVGAVSLGLDGEE